jgi:deoxyribodipyrimidine photo-lyase
LDILPKEDKRVSFIYNSVQKLKSLLKTLGLDLAVFYGKPIEVISKLTQEYGIDGVLCSVDEDDYAKKRDDAVSKMIRLRRFADSYILYPEHIFNKEGKPYRVFTPFYKSLSMIWESDALELYAPVKNARLLPSSYYQDMPALEDLGFEEQTLPGYLYKEPLEVLNDFVPKLQAYQEARDFFYLDATSKMAVFLRFGLISPRQIFNAVKKETGSEFYIRELFWREFYRYILFHFPKSQFENFDNSKVVWSSDLERLEAWKNGNTGVPIIDAAMRHLNQTGEMHNRLRMITASFLCKNLLIDWKEGEAYFALKLLDYEASSNIGSWQWAASTGADAVPYFRIFNPYVQSVKFDKEACFIKSVIPELKEIEPKLLHKEQGLSGNMFIENYPSNSIVDMRLSKERAITAFKAAKSKK